MLQKKHIRIFALLTKGTMGISIRDSIATLANLELRKNEIYSKVGVATDVNVEDNTFTFTPNDETSEVGDVMLKSIQTGEGGSVVIVPEEGSFVAVSFLSATTAICTHVEVAQEIRIDSVQTIINGGDNGGLININEITAKINELVSRLNSLIAAFRSHQHSGVESGAGVTNPTTTPVEDLNLFNAQDYEDPTVTH